MTSAPVLPCAWRDMASPLLPRAAGEGDREAVEGAARPYPGLSLGTRLLASCSRVRPLSPLRGQLPRTRGSRKQKCVDPITCRRKVSALLLDHLPRKPDHRVRHGVSVGENLFRRNSDDSDALPRQPFVPRCVSGGVIGDLVNKSIDFNGELCVRTIEVEDVPSAGMLPTKVQAVYLAHSQAQPQPHLGRRHAPSQGLGQSDIAAKPHAPPQSLRDSSPEPEGAGKCRDRFLNYIAEVRQ